MLLHLAGLWALFVVFTVVFSRDNPAAARSARSSFNASRPGAIRAAPTSK